MLYTRRKPRRYNSRKSQILVPKSANNPKKISLRECRSGHSNTYIYQVSKHYLKTSENFKLFLPNHNVIKNEVVTV